MSIDLTSMFTAFDFRIIDRPCRLLLEPNMTAAGAQQQQQLLYPQQQQQQQLYMLILVLSAPDHFEQRQRMRSMGWRVPPWRGGAARIVFLLGHVDSEGECTAAFCAFIAAFNYLFTEFSM
jgi:hypothetical protein